MKRFIIALAMMVVPVAPAFAAYTSLSDLSLQTMSHTSRTVCVLDGEGTPVYSKDGTYVVGVNYAISNCKNHATDAEYQRAAGLEITRQLVAKGFGQASRWPSNIGQWITRYQGGER